MFAHAMLNAREQRSIGAASAASDPAPMAPGVPGETIEPLDADIADRPFYPLDHEYRTPEPRPAGAAPVLGGHGPRDR